jgi:hypothetical protein
MFESKWLISHFSFLKEKERKEKMEKYEVFFFSHLAALSQTNYKSLLSLALQTAKTTRHKQASKQAG